MLVSSAHGDTSRPLPSGWPPPASHERDASRTSASVLKGVGWRPFAVGASSALVVARREDGFFRMFLDVRDQKPRVRVRELAVQLLLPQHHDLFRRLGQKVVAVAQLEEPGSVLG